jgi:hypothetical protein
MSHKSLLIDKDNNIFTTGRVYYESGQTMLFCFSKKGELLYKTELNTNSDCITDIALDSYSDLSNPNLYCSGDNKLHIFQFG